MAFVDVALHVVEHDRILMRRGQRRDRPIVADGRDAGILRTGHGGNGRRVHLPHHRFELADPAPLHAVDHRGDLVEVAALGVPVDGLVLGGFR